VVPQTLLALAAVDADGKKEKKYKNKQAQKDFCVPSHSATVLPFFIG
jgi:hypothetical protein